MSPNTARAYRAALAAAGLLDGAPDDLPALEVLRAAIEQHRPPKVAPQESSSIETWSAAVESMLKAELTAKAIYDRLRLEHGPQFEGSYWAVKRMCRRLKRLWGASA